MTRLWVPVSLCPPPLLSSAPGVMDTAALMAGVVVMHGLSSMDSHSLRMTWLHHC